MKQMRLQLKSIFRKSKSFEIYKKNILKIGSGKIDRKCAVRLETSACFFQGNISPVLFSPFALAVSRRILDWSNSNVSYYLSLTNNCVSANSRRGETVCKCKRAKITLRKITLHTVYIHVLYLNVYHRRYMYHIVICVKFGRKLMVKVWNKRSTWIYNFSSLLSNVMFQTHIHFRIIIKIFLIMYECTNVNRKV